MTREDDRHTRLEQMFNEALEKKLFADCPLDNEHRKYDWAQRLEWQLKEKAMTEYMVSSQVARDYAKITVGRLERYARTQSGKQQVPGPTP
jgi:hypothetical protein